MDTFTILAAIGVLLLILIASVFALLVYSGLFQKVEVGAGKPPIGRLVIAYKFARGPYRDVGPLFTEVMRIAPDNKALGIYYDDPHKVESHRLRHVVASVLAEDEQKVDEELKKKFEEEGFKIACLPSVENVVRTSFPHNSFFSIFIAVQKVYPKLMEYVQEHRLCAHPFLEVYEGATMHFIAPLSKQKEFYVPESLQHFPGEEPYEPVYSESDESQDSSEGDLSTSVTDSLAEPSLLDSPEKVRAAYFGKEAVEESEVLEKEEIAQGKKSKSAEGERGSDEESSSSFEELKMEAESKNTAQ